MFISCIAIYLIPQYAYLNSITSSNGKTEGIWAIGFVACMIMVTAHHLMMIIGTRTFNKVIVILYFISYILFMPLVIIFENLLEGVGLYAIAFSDIMN